MNFTGRENCPWQHVPTAVVPPCCLPPDAPPALGMALISGELQSLVVGGLQQPNMNITVKQIQLLMADLGIELPVFPNGSGKNGRILKVDLLRTLVRNMFKDMTREQQEEIINNLLGKGKKGVLDGEDPEHMLKLVSKMDPREAPQFEKIVRHAVDELAVRAMKAKQKSKPQPPEAEAGEKPAQSVEEQAEPGPAVERPPPAPAARAPIGRARVHAPPEIVSLLPQVDNLYFKWLPAKRNVAVDFQRVSA